MSTEAEVDRKRPLGKGAHVLLALGWYYSEIHRGVARFARDHQWHVTFDFDDLVPRDWQGDGVITLLGAQQQVWRSLKNFSVPMVDLAESRPDIPLPRVTMDNVAIGKMGAQHFLDRGFRNFAFIHRWELGVSHRRGDSFAAELAQHNLGCEVLSWQKEMGRRADTREQRHRWLVQHLAKLPKPLAVFAPRDIEAVEIIEAAMAIGALIPDEISILGVDNTETICDCLQTPLSSIDNNLEQVGYEGASLLARLMAGEPPPAKTIYVAPSRVVERRSTDSMAVPHPQVAAALRYMQEQAHLPINMIDVVREVAMSRSGLEKAFREHYVRPPMEELRRIRLLRAQKMLLQTSEKIVNIAKETGFETSQQLCRVFRQHFGMTPKEFRSQATN
ncbi:DNA-binding transcriptional regulator [Blastopirellula sp. JC732]|uniref:DNA-binding transcriptional regulator n=1 Tax=Blastopirellula sediminis TaxID=2894196 RepID=A0A9X1MJ74_9BACT|nr:DNA-binding transcriptional regulator [Blastopirellula sediminis]MCC9607902.1 DNA-binding transcriptional regulator [Blastopirellula sediminis]MCC9627305.1 DNA-binding transcriptional regulator [Blastopirellula sediminis]